MTRPLTLAALTAAAVAGMLATGAKAQAVDKLAPSKFAVTIELQQSVITAPGSPYNREKSETIHLNCDMSVSLKCSNDDGLDNSSIVRIVRNGGDRSLPYKVDIQPRIATASKWYAFGPYLMPDMIDGVRFEKTDKAAKATYRVAGTLKVTPAKN